MVKMTFVSLMVAVSCPLARADSPSALPKDVPPVIGTAVVTPSSSQGNRHKWSIKLVVPKVVWHVVGRRRPKKEWPRFKVTAKLRKLS